MKTVSDSQKEHVVRLMDMKDDNSLIVLHVSEGGSHAWGYASDNSDLDVKFLFAHNKTKYTEMWPPVDNLQFKDETLNAEFQGWDVKKFLGLVYKGNAQTYEFLFSPITYIETPVSTALRSFTLEELTTKKHLVLGHYYGLASRTYKERVKNVGEPSMKKYLYVTRPLLTVEEMHNSDRMPILNYETLLAEAGLSKLVPPNVYDSLHQLLDLKRLGDLTTINKSDFSHVDQWVESRLQFWSDKLKSPENVAKLTATPGDKEKYNMMFKWLANLD